jgi:LPS-assembly lipoprotein
VIVRRALSILSLATLLGGCGFTPLYAPNVGGGMGASTAGLSAINVTLMGERAGQLMRDALQRRLALNGGSSAKLYNLSVNFYVANEGISIERGESIPTRNRSAGIATWTLTSNDAEQRTVTSGRARQLDGNNPLSLQYF